MFSPTEGEHKGKHYLFEESHKRFQLIRNYVKNRPAQFKNERWFLVTGIKSDMKWDYANYSNSTPYTKHIPLPELVYDIHKDKIYEFKGALWSFNP